YLNVPVGAFALAMCASLVRDPGYLREQRDAALRGPHRFDSPALGLLCAAAVSWEVLLSKGQEWDWFGDPFWRIQTLAAVFAFSLVALVWHELRTPDPLINFRTLLDRNFRSACVIIFCAFAALYANTVSLPGLLQSLFGYDATTSGLVLSPAGLGAVILLPVVG